MEKYKKKIILTGGGTGGSVSPLLSIFDEFKKKKNFNHYYFLWIGTKNGIEKKMVEEVGIKFKIISHGKLRRYLSLENFIDPFKIIFGFFQSIFIILKFKPNLVISAGGFVGVPVVLASWLLGVKVLIHQQDIRPGLANKLMAIFADIITVTFKKSCNDYGKKAIWIGNPIRGQLLNAKYKLKIDDIKKKFGLKNNIPVVLVVGGGTGAISINKIIWKNINELTKFCQIIHITGKNKNGYCKDGYFDILNYKNYDFFKPSKIAEVLIISDLVISRAGLGILTELSYLGKPSILIPMPNSHQEDNAKIFKEKEAAIVLNQENLTDKEFVEDIKKALNDKELCKKLSNNIKIVIRRDANKKIMRIIDN